ncbi:MAG: ArsB/NhaD family transporter [Pseudomonadota bacterium]
MILTIIIFIATYVLIASEKIDKSLAALLGAGLVLFFHLAPYHELFAKVNFNVIFLLMGMMIAVNILATTGIFEWVAIVIARWAKGNGMVILIGFLLITAIISAFLDNVTTIVLIAPITILITQILEIPTVPILILEAIFSNIGGTATMVGDPPNIIIGSETALSFNDFIFHLSPVIIILSAILVLAFFYLFARMVEVAPEIKMRVMRAEPKLAIIEPARLKRALPLLGLILLGFFCSRYINVEPGIIALCGSLLMVIVCRLDMHQILLKVEWVTILFFIGLFILIGALEINGVFNILGSYMLTLTQQNLLLTVLAVLWFSAIASAIVDNIPLVIAMIPVIKSLIPFFAMQKGIVGYEELIRLQIEQPLFWALALGACLGGNGTLIGASANILVAQIARRNKYKLSFWHFTKYGFPIMIVCLVICTLYLYLRYFALTGNS